MSDTTDTEGKMYSLAINAPQPLNITFTDGSQLIFPVSGKASFTGDVDESARVFFDAVIRHRDSQLEAERQRADKAELELKQPLPIGELIQRLEGQTHEKWFSLSDLKGEQVPMSIDADIIRDANRYRFLRDEDSWGEDSDSWDVETRTGLISSENLMELRLDHFDAAIDARMAASDIAFLNPVTTQRKPVISKEKLCDWLEDNFDIDDSQRDAFANCFAHHCNCIVKEGN